nr:hypothetical protein [uncultured Duganella sp.]
MRLLLTLILCCAAGACHAASNFSFDPAPGPHGVGLRVVEQYDYARGYLGNYDVVTGKALTGEKARPVQPWSGIRRNAPASASPMATTCA